MHLWNTDPSWQKSGQLEGSMSPRLRWSVPCASRASDAKGSSPKPFAPPFHPVRPVAERVRLGLGKYKSEGKVLKNWSEHFHHIVLLFLNFSAPSLVLILIDSYSQVVVHFIFGMRSKAAWSGKFRDHWKMMTRINWNIHLHFHVSRFPNSIHRLPGWRGAIKAPWAAPVGPSPNVRNILSTWINFSFLPFCPPAQLNLGLRKNSINVYVSTYREICIEICTYTCIYTYMYCIYLLLLYFRSTHQCDIQTLVSTIIHPLFATPIRFLSICAWLSGWFVHSGAGTSPLGAGDMIRPGHHKTCDWLAYDVPTQMIQ